MKKSIQKIDRVSPCIAKSAFIAADADVIGEVTLGENTSVWYHATVRADSAAIIVGNGSNVQDNVVLHVDEEFGIQIGNHSSIGHGAILHGCQIGSETLVGMGAIILNGAKIGRHCLIGAGTLITQNTVIPDGSLVMGSPGKVIRKLNASEITANLENAKKYIREAEKHKRGVFECWNPKNHKNKL